MLKAFSQNTALNKFRFSAFDAPIGATRTAANICLFLYSLALMTSMAGMEIFSTLLVFPTLLLFDKKQKYFYKGWLFFALFMVVVVLGYWSVGTTDGMWKALGWMRWFLLLGIITVAFQQNPPFKTIFTGIYTGFLLSAAVSIYQYITGYDFIRGREIPYFAIKNEIYRVTGFFNLPTTYSYVVAIFSFAPLYFAWTSKSNRWRYFHAAVFCLSLLILVLGYTRGAWLGAFAGYVVFSFLISKRVFFSTLALMLIAFTAFYAADPGFQNRVDRMLDKDHISYYHRIEIWEAHYTMFKEHPWLGVGLHRNGKLNPEYHEKLGRKGAFSGHAHNSYLEFAAGTGIIGLALYLFFVGIYLYYSFQLLKVSPRGSPEFLQSVTLIAVQACFLTSSLLDCNFRDAEVRHNYMFALAFINYCYYTYLQRNPKVSN